MSTTTVHDSKPRSNLTTLLDVCGHNMSILQCHACLKRVRINRMLVSPSILEIMLPDRVRIKHVVDTNLETPYTVDRIVIVAFRVREHCRDAHGMLKIQDSGIKLILQSDPEHIVFPQTQAD